MFDFAHVAEAVLVDEAFEHVEFAQRRTGADDDGAEDVLHVRWQLLQQHFRKHFFRHCVEYAVRPLDDLARSLFLQDKAFFYSRFIVEEVA